MRKADLIGRFIVWRLMPAILWLALAAAILILTGSMMPDWLPVTAGVIGCTTAICAQSASLFGKATAGAVVGLVLAFLIVAGLLWNGMVID